MDNIVVMVTLFAIVIVGFIAGKVGYMGGDFDKRLSSLVIDITCPALILSSTMSGQLPDRAMILPLLVISLLTYLLLAGVALLLPRWLTKRRDDEGIVGFALMFGNVGFIGYPVVASIFGHEAVFYAAVLNVVNTFAVFTVGVMLIMGGRGAYTFHKRVLWSTPMLAAYLAILIVALGIDDVPRVISQPLTLIGQITVPAALLIIGSSMSQLSARTMLGNSTVYVTTLFRLALLPLALFFLFSALGFQQLVVDINTVVIAMPVATYGTILCLKHGRDITLITEVTFITTLLSVVTIPLVAMLLEMMG
ncbi:MAG: AEC family transporter [Prevotella sp.]|nr:AEC family transporter [Prevotella sp.]